MIFVSKTFLSHSLFRSRREQTHIFASRNNIDDWINHREKSSLGMEKKWYMYYRIEQNTIKLFACFIFLHRTRCRHFLSRVFNELIYHWFMYLKWEVTKGIGRPRWSYFTGTNRAQRQYFATFLIESCKAETRRFACGATNFFFLFVHPARLKLRLLLKNFYVVDLFIDTKLVFYS